VIFVSALDYVFVCPIGFERAMAQGTTLGIGHTGRHAINVASINKSLNQKEISGGIAVDSHVMSNQIQFCRASDLFPEVFGNTASFGDIRMIRGMSRIYCFPSRSVKACKVIYVVSVSLTAGFLPNEDTEGTYLGSGAQGVNK
jgi:hypothetical protein